MIDVEHAAVSLLSLWSSFFIVVGTAAATLTGLQFVVIVLGAQIEVTAEGAVAAFGTPTVVHFGVVLLISTMLMAPWSSLVTAAVFLGTVALAGFVYALLVLRQATRQTDYVPVLEDWIWHGGLPILAYAALVGSAISLAGDPGSSLFVVGASLLLLLFVGIHNAWDSVTYLANRRRNQAIQAAAEEAERDDE